MEKRSDMKLHRSTLVLIICILAFFGGFTRLAEAEGMRDMTTAEIVRDMGIGINLGNTFEAGGDWFDRTNIANFEQAWGSPIVTEKLIKAYKESGFGVVRVPVNWSNMMRDDYTLHPDFVARIKEVAGWITKNGMYAILNIHHEGWIADMPTNKDEVMKRYTRFWEQISDAFRDFDDHLMLESQNEDGGWSKVWNSHGGDEGKEEAFSYLNEMNQKFVDVVRVSGGNNVNRHLLLAGYYTNIDHTCDPLFKMPQDPVNRCAISVHYYDPFNFTCLTESTDWGKPQNTWGTKEDIAELNKSMDMMKDRFVDKGIPVIVGEFGAYANGTQRLRNKYMLAVCEAIYSRNMCPILWDTPSDAPDRNFDRKQFKMTNIELMNGFKAIKKKGDAADQRKKETTRNEKRRDAEDNYATPMGFDVKKPGVKYGEISSFRYYSKTSESERNATIILPPDYDKSKKYPVLYLLHGLGADEYQWLGGHPNEIIFNLVSEGKAKEMIVVMPNIGVRHKSVTQKPEFYSVEHFREYDLFLDDLRDNLIPAVEKNYAVLPGRDNRAVAGLSMGGRSALHVGITLIDDFAFIGAFTPAIGVLPYPVEKGLFTKETLTLPEKYRKNTWIMIVKGSRDDVVGGSPEEYSRTLKANDVEHVYYVTEGGHDFDVWKNGLYHFVRGIFKQKSGHSDQKR